MSKGESNNLTDQHGNRLIDFGKDNKLVYLSENFGKNETGNDIYIMLTITDKEKCLNLLPSKIDRLFEELKKDTQDTRNRMLRELPTGGEALKRYKAEEQYELELKRLEEKRSKLQKLKEEYQDLKEQIEEYRAEKEREKQREDQINRENIKKVINDTFDNFMKGLEDEEKEWEEILERDTGNEDEVK